MANRDSRHFPISTGPIFPYTTQRTYEDALAEIGDLHLRVKELECQLTTLEWLRSQTIVATPEMIWMNTENGEKLDEKIRNTKSLKELRHAERNI